MAHLLFTGVSADGKQLILQSDRGVEFTVDVTPALRAALDPERDDDATAIRVPSPEPRITPPARGQSEAKMTSTLRPREIQDRIRSGESPEVVATMAGTSVESIMPFVVPVLAEREHVAERAQTSSLRRAAGAEGGAPQSRVLRDAVAAHLRGQETKPDTVEWDSARRDDGRWTVTAIFDTPRRSGTAHFTFDARGNYVLADDDDARWLVGDLIAAPAVPTNDDLHAVRQRRLAAVVDDEPPVTAEARDDLQEVLELANDEPVVYDPQPAMFDEPLRSTVPEPAAEVSPAAAEDDVDGAAPHRRPVQKKRGRASVPSWDEIMFGSSD